MHDFPIDGGRAMDQHIPNELSGALEHERRRLARRRSRFRVRLNDVELPVLELTHDGFIIESEQRPMLRGYMDIFHGDERILHGLAVCTWVRDGMVAYEFKHDTTAGEIRVDHEPPAHSGLLEGPR